MLIEDLEVNVFDDEFGLEVQPDSNLAASKGFVTATVTTNNDESFEVSFNKIEVAIELAGITHAFLNITNTLPKSVKDDIKELLITKYLEHKVQLSMEKD